MTANIDWDNISLGEYLCYRDCEDDDPSIQIPDRIRAKFSPLPGVILNLTQHDASDDQKEAGVVDLPEDQQTELKIELTFATVPTASHIAYRAVAIASLARKWGRENLVPGQELKVMIGGAPYLMSALETEFRRDGIKAVYAFTERRSRDVKQPDGSVRKTQVFRHAGFVEATYGFTDKPYNGVAI